MSSGVLPVSCRWYRHPSIRTGGSFLFQLFFRLAIITSVHISVIRVLCPAIARCFIRLICSLAKTGIVCWLMATGHQQLAVWCLSWCSLRTPPPHYTFLADDNDLGIADGGLRVSKLSFPTYSPRKSVNSMPRSEDLKMDDYRLKSVEDTKISPHPTTNLLVAANSLAANLLIANPLPNNSLVTNASNCF